MKPIEKFGRDEYDTQIYTSKASSYLEIKDNDYVKVYDLKNNLKTTISIKETEINKYYFRQVLYSWVFIIEECQKQPYSCKDVLYNENGKELVRVDSITVESYPNAITDEFLLPKNSDIISTTNRDNEEITSSWILIKNGELAVTFKNCKDPKHNYGLNHNYLFYYEPDAENPLTYGGDTYKILNLNTMKDIKAPIEYTNNTGIANQSPNGEYVILTTGNDYFVYDSELNLKYESEKWVIPVNEKQVITSNKYDRSESEPAKTSLINIETGKENELDVKGEYYTSNAKGLVTYDGTNYYLYSFK